VQQILARQRGKRGIVASLMLWIFVGEQQKRPLTSAEVSADPTVLPWYFPNQVILNRNRNPELVEITKTGNLVSRMKLF